MEIEVGHRPVPNRRRLTRAILFREGYVVLVGLLFLISGGSYLLPGAQVGSSLHPPYPIDFAINGLYFTGGAMIVYGFLSRRLGIETAGHAMLVPALLLSFAAAVAELGLHRTTILVVIFALASAARAYGLVVGWHELGKR